MNLKKRITHFCMHEKYRNKYIKENRTENAFNKLTFDNPNVDIDLVTIAFENPKMISYQIRLIRKHLKDNYSYVIADNSNDEKKSKDIERICRDSNVPYIRLPKNPYNGAFAMGSYSNGAAMNYVYYHYIKKSRSRYFGFLDHDVFPIHDFSILDQMKKQSFWGTLRCVPTKNGYCCIYPWAGFCFFDKYKFDANQFDFMPLKGIGDTGAANYKNCFLPIIKSDDFLEYTFANLKRIDIEGTHGSPQSSQYELLGTMWLHYLNASNWSNENLEIKDKVLEELITKFL